MDKQSIPTYLFVNTGWVRLMRIAGCFPAMRGGTTLVPNFYWDVQNHRTWKAPSYFIWTSASMQSLSWTWWNLRVRSGFSCSRVWSGFSCSRVLSLVGFQLLIIICLLSLQVNLKEQGRLLRQNEFIVSQGKGKKCLRHVFLFEELILFSKARRFPDRKVRFSFHVKKIQRSFEGYFRWFPTAHFF